MYISAPQRAITKDFINMVVKEDVPEGILKNLQYSPETSQIWSTKYNQYDNRECHKRSIKSAISIAR